MRTCSLALAFMFWFVTTPSTATDIKTGTAPSTSVGKMATSKTGKSGGVATAPTTVGTVAELTEQECTRLGGTVTSGIPNDSTCKTNTRCKMTLGNGDIRSVCVDEVAP
jgi:hypothetical protein